MKNTLLLLTCFFCINFSIAQSNGLDSLEKVTEILEDTDTTKAFNYCELAFNYAGYDQIDKAIEILNKVQPLVLKFNNERLTARFYYVSGRTYYSKRKLIESLNFLLKAVKLYEAQNLKQQQSACFNIIGLIYQDQTFYEKAGFYLKKALDIRVELKDSLRLSGNYSNVGLNFYKLAHKKKIHKEDCIEMREAIKNLNAALLIAKRMRLATAEAAALGNLSSIMTDKEQYTEAKKFGERALEIYQNIEDHYQVVISLIDIAAIYLAQKKYKEAIPYLQQSLKIASTNKFLDLQRYIYGNLATVAENQNDYKQAYIYEKELLALNDSIFNSENMKQINEMQIKYETEKKETENAFLIEKNELSDKAIKNQKTAIIFIIAGLLSTLALAFFIFRGFKKQKKANQIISKQKKEVENKNLLINEQKELLEAKQKEVIDSINYAKRIQQAHMPSDKYVAKNLDRLKKG